MQQIDTSEIGDGYQSFAELDSTTVRLLNERGVVLAELTDSDEAGPVRYAIVRLGNGTCVMVVHHYAHNLGFVELRARPSDASPRAVVDAFIHELGPSPEILDVLDRWD